VISATLKFQFHSILSDKIFVLMRRAIAYSCTLSIRHTSGRNRHFLIKPCIVRCYSFKLSSLTGVMRYQQMSSEGFWWGHASSS
jgi:hypothetical protein